MDVNYFLFSKKEGYNMVAPRNVFVLRFSLIITKADCGKLSQVAYIKSFHNIATYPTCRWSSCGAAATWQRVVSSCLSANAAGLNQSTFGAWEYLWAVLWTCSPSAQILRSNTCHYSIKTWEVCCLLPNPITIKLKGCVHM